MFTVNLIHLNQLYTTLCGEDKKYNVVIGHHPYWFVSLVTILLNQVYKRVKNIVDTYINFIPYIGP